MDYQAEAAHSRELKRRLTALKRRLAIARNLNPHLHKELPEPESVEIPQELWRIPCEACSEIFNWRFLYHDQARGICDGCTKLRKATAAAKRNLSKIGPLSQTDPQLVAEWSSTNELTPAEVTRGSKKKVHWLGGCGHSWSSTIGNRALNGNGCPFCTGKLILPGFNDLASQNPQLASELMEKGISADSVGMKDSKRNLLWRCVICGDSWRATVNSRLKKLRGECPHCKTGSYLERAVEKELRGYPWEILINQRVVPVGRRKLELDFFLPQLNLAFEVQDFATHSETMDTEPLEGIWLKRALARGYEPFKKGPAYHEEKRAAALRELKVTVVDVWENQIVSGDFKKNIEESLKLAERMPAHGES